MRTTWPVALAAALFVCGCKKKQAAPPSYTLPPAATAAAAATSAPDNAHLKEQARILAELNPFPPLDTAALTRLPNGDVWVKYPCGIMVQDMRPSDEVPPRFGQFVSISYTEYLSDNQAREGKIVKQQKAHDPWNFRLGSKSVIIGLSMGLSTMKPYSRRRIFIPSELAYGEKGDPETGIGPDQPVIFDVELLKVYGEAEPNLPPPLEFIGPPAPKKPPATQQ